MILAFIGPFFECLDPRLVFERMLWNVVAIGFEVVAQLRFKLGSGAKTGLFKDLADAEIEALHMPLVGRWRCGLQGFILCKRKATH